MQKPHPCKERKDGAPNANRPKIGLRCDRLELPRVLLSPALDDYFFVGVELDGVASLGVHIAEETSFPSGEGEVGHRGGYAYVDADVACGGLVTESARGRSAGSEKGSLVAIWAALQKVDRFVHISRV